MNDSIAKLQFIINFIRRYSVILAVVAFGGLYAYLIVTSDRLAKVEPSQSSVNEKFKAVKSPKLDPAIIQKLTELEDQNITFQALIDEARRNPFQE